MRDLIHETTPGTGSDSYRRGMLGRVMTDLYDVVAAHGGMVHATQLRTAGVARAQLDRALRAGDVRRIRRGWYAAPSAHPDLVRTVRIGGAASCVTALRLRGVWTSHRDLHVRVARGDAVARESRCRLHWSDTRVGLRVLDDPATSLQLAVGCVPVREAVAIADSVANTRLLGLDEIEAVLNLTRRGQRVHGLMDPSAESGLETFARLGLRAARLTVRSQVAIEDVGRVDLVIGDRLVLELDGAEWHTGLAAIERDRRRDRELVARGYVVLRLTSQQLLGEWDVALNQILRVVRRGDHRWRTAQLSRRNGIEPRRAL